MKSFTPTITLLIVLNLVAAGFALNRTSPATEGKQTVSEVDVMLKQAGVTLKEKQDILNTLTSRLSGWTSQYAGVGSVLVVPTDEMGPQDLVTIIEDMTIMCRIFDKKLAPSYPIPIEILNLNRKVGSTLGFSMAFSQDSHPTESMYVQGYGIIFLTKVGFPLSPLPKVEAEKVEEGDDPVWEQTKSQILASEKDIKVDYVHERDAAARQYDSEKVEEIKTKVIKTLKHAANIRSLKADESVILLVAGNRPGLVVAEHGDEPHRYQYLFSGTAKKDIFWSSLMTIRAKKSDINAFSKGELDFDEFRKKVVIFTYPYLSEAAGSQSTRLLRVLPSR